jgi:hypothetical protein
MRSPVKRTEYSSIASSFIEWCKTDYSLGKGLSWFFLFYQSCHSQATINIHCIILSPKFIESHKSDFSNFTRGISSLAFVAWFDPSSASKTSCTYQGLCMTSTLCADFGIPALLPAISRLSDPVLKRLVTVRGSMSWLQPAKESHLLQYLRRLRTTFITGKEHLHNHASEILNQ